MPAKPASDVQSPARATPQFLKNWTNAGRVSSPQHSEAVFAEDQFYDTITHKNLRGKQARNPTTQVLHQKPQDSMKENPGYELNPTVNKNYLNPTF